MLWILILALSFLTWLKKPREISKCFKLDSFFLHIISLQKYCSNNLQYKKKLNTLLYSRLIHSTLPIQYGAWIILKYAILNIGRKTKSDDCITLNINAWKSPLLLNLTNPFSLHRSMYLVLGSPKILFSLKTLLHSLYQQFQRYRLLSIFYNKTIPTLKWYCTDLEHIDVYKRQPLCSSAIFAVR